VVFDGETEMKQVTTLTDGAGFGELALIKDQPRSASILCEHDTHFAILSKEDYMSIIGKVEARKLEVFIEFLHDIPIFRPWTKKKLEVLTFYLNKQMFKRKQEVFRIGSRPEYVYIVQDGEFELTQPFGRKDRKENFTLKVALLGRGEVFGDEEVMKNAYHTLNCVCYSTFGTLLAIKAEDFKIKVHSHELLNEFKKKDLSKHMLRSTRIESFRNYLTVAKDDEGEKIIRSSISSPFSKKIPNPIHKRDHTPTFLTPEKIERIKKKALGRIIFSDISPKLSKKRCQFLLSRTPENNIRDSSKNIAKNNEIKISPMRCHRPGGYYIGKLKKSWKGLKIIHS
jgi:CRP-like cAMP-binding protein